MAGEKIEKDAVKKSSQELKKKKTAQEAREVQDAVHVLKDIYIKNVYDAIRYFKPRFKKNVIIKACRIIWQDNPRRIADLDKDFPPK
jgi:hypothetical protein